MPRRDPNQRERDLAELARRYLRKSYKDLATRETQAAIAADLGVSQVQISKDIRTLRERWKQSAIRDVDEGIGEMLAHLSEVMEQAWLGWEASVQPKEREVKQKTETEGGTGAERGTTEGNGKKGKRTTFQVQTTKIDSAGQPAYLNIVLECVRQARELQGLDKPHKYAPTSPDGTSPYNPVVRVATDLSDDELAAIISRSGV